MRLITVPEWSKNYINVRVPRGYELARRLPRGVRVELGRTGQDKPRGVLQMDRSWRYIERK